MSPIPPHTPLRVRTVFISDVHLGFKGCRPEFLLDFLRRIDCECIYLVGDIVDRWSLKRSFYRPQQHNDVIRTLLEARRRGVDGMICGHSHRPEVVEIDGIVYCDDGDWVESCTAPVEDWYGRLNLLRWTEQTEVLSGAWAPAGALAPVRAA